MTSDVIGVVGSARRQAWSSRLIRRPLWIVSGQVGVILAIFEGFGVRGVPRPQVTIALLLCCMVGVVAFGPPQRVTRIVVTAPVVALVTWWMFSTLWTFNSFGWWTDTQRTMPFVIACVVLIGMLPTETFRAALVAGCYVAIAVTVLELLVHPGSATVNPDGVPGWRGGFIHKNAMGPFMVFGMLVLASFDRPSGRRTVGLVTALLLVVMSQSTTGLTAGLVTLLIFVLLRRLAISDLPARASYVAGALVVAGVAWMLSSTLVPAVLGVRGKDATLTGRTDIWSGVWRAIMQRPWQGYGIGGVWGNPAVEPGRSILRGLGFTVFHSHNGFLEVLLLLGVGGLALYVWLMVSTIRLGIVHLRADTRMAVFIVCYVVLIAVLSITEVNLFGIWLGLLCGFHCAAARGAVESGAVRHPALTS